MPMVKWWTKKRMRVRLPEAVLTSRSGVPAWSCGACVVGACVVRAVAREPDPGANLGSAERGKMAKPAALLDKIVGVRAAYLFE